RQEAKKLAEKKQLNLILTDGPPGVGCPVIASIGGATAVLIVAEPTVSGKHDMERVAQLASHFRVPCLLCINKYDLNLAETEALEALAESKGIGIVGKIPFDSTFTEAMVQGKAILEFDRGALGTEAVYTVWANLSEALKI
ncbi:MAG: (4Fe-4S)-binding protein, partial [Deltaproteobacteria bacterium]